MFLIFAGTIFPLLLMRFGIDVGSMLAPFWHKNYVPRRCLFTFFQMVLLSVFDSKIASKLDTWRDTLRHQHVFISRPGSPKLSGHPPCAFRPQFTPILLHLDGLRLPLWSTGVPPKKHPKQNKSKQN